MKAANRIIGPVWMGSDPGEYANKLAPFRVIVACAEEIPYTQRDFPGHIVIPAPMDDDPEAGEAKMRHTLARARAAVTGIVAALYQSPPASRVLATCHMGLNRSGLVAALLIRKLYGLPGRKIVQLIREQRHPRALSNPLFEAAVLRLR